MKNKRQNLEILHQDDSIFVVNKPPFLLSIPDRWKAELPSVKTELLKKYDEAFIVHRLDKETSGILVLGRNKESHRSLSIQFEERSIDKKYLVLVDGNDLPETGSINSPLAPHPSKPGKMRVHRNGKASLTEYRVLERFNDFTLAEATIKTGRMHQIRVHFESIGYPLAIDADYGRRGSLSIADIKKKKVRLGKEVREPKPLMFRSSLHAWKLSFVHPDSSERVHFEAELPKDFRAVLNQLRKWG